MYEYHYKKNLKKIKKIVKSWIQFQLLCSQEKLYHSIPIERNVHLKPILLCGKKNKKKRKPIVSRKNLELHSNIHL